MIAVRRERGATLVITAAVLPVLILMTAFAVDLGRQRSSRRTMQARADIVALDMVRLADGRTEDQITGVDASGGTTPALYAAYIQDTADRNHVDISKLTIEWGTWNGVIFVQTLGNAVPDAVEVVASESTEYFFQPGSGDVSRTAIATTDDLAHLSLGTSLAQANLGNSALLNQVLTALVCGAPTNPPPPTNVCPRQATITAGGYQGLATHNVTLDALRAAGGYGSVDELMTTRFTAPQFASLAADAFRNNGDPATAAVYDGQGNSLRDVSQDTNKSFTIADVAAAQTPSGGAAAGINVNPYNIFMSGLEFANGNNFIDLTTSMSTVTTPAGISNLALASRYQVIQAPKEAWGRVGSTPTTNFHTAQVRLLHTLSFTLNATAGGTGISGPVSLPIDVSGGGATATLTDIACTQPDTNSTIDATTSPRIFTGSVGNAFTPTNPVTIGTVNLTVGGLPAGTVGLSAYGAIGAGSQSTATSNLTNVAVGETRTAPGSGFGLGGAITSVQVQSAAPVPALDSSVQNTLNQLLSALDAATAPVLSVLGLSVSTADLRNMDVNCWAARLAG